MEQTSRAQAGTREEVWKNYPILKIFFQCKYFITCYWSILLGNLNPNDVFSIFGAAFVCAENLLAGSFPDIRTQGTQHTELSYPCTIHVQVLFLNFCNLTGTDSTCLWHLTSSSRKKKTNCAPRKSWMMRKIDSNWKKNFWLRKKPFEQMTVSFLFSNYVFDNITFCLDGFVFFFQLNLSRIRALRLDARIFHFGEWYNCPFWSPRADYQVSE